MSDVRTERATAAVTPETMKGLEKMATMLGVTRSELVSRYIDEGLAYDRRMSKLVGAPGMNHLMQLVNVAISGRDDRDRIAQGLRRLAAVWHDQQTGQGALFPLEGGSAVSEANERRHRGTRSQRSTPPPGTRPATA